MKILYIHQYFKTPLEPGGTRSYWIAKELIKNGHTVTMLTTSSSISSIKEKKIVNGINVIYFKVPYNQEMSIIERLFSFLNFMFRSSYYALKEKNVDLVIATSTPLTVGFPALLLKLIKSIPFIFEVRDLWPEVPIQMGGIKNPIFIRLAKWFEKTVYFNSSHIIALSPGMANGILEYNISESKTSIIPNMAKIDEFYPRLKNKSLMIQLGLKQESFKLIHFGSLGVANGAMSLIHSALLLKNNPDIEFIFIGGGATEKSLIDKCKESNLTNVHFLGRFSMDKTSEIVNFCEASIVSFLDLPILYTNSPNKFFDSLSAGKPLIVNSAGWTKEIVEKYNCGYYVNPKDPQDLVNKLLYLKENPKKIIEMGQESRKLAENKYDKTILCQEFADIVNKLANKRKYV